MSVFLHEISRHTVQARLRWPLNLGLMPVKGSEKSGHKLIDTEREPVYDTRITGR